MVHVGIDIGTSNTVVAITNSRGEPEVLTIKGGDSLIPSVLYVDETGGARTVGADAIAEWATPDFDQRGTFRRWKLDMGEGRLIREMHFGGPKSNPTAVTPEQLTTWLVEEVLKQVSDGTGGVDVESVLVTVPHGWRRDRPDKCRATRLAAAAAQLAGNALEVQPLTVSEPVAAAVYWLWEAQKAGAESPTGFEGQPILVIDVGGGTFDLSLVKVGATSEDPLIVVDAVNHNRAGDYATALVLSRVVELYDGELDCSVPTDPDQLLALIGSGEDLWLRGWFLQCQEIVHRLSSSIAAGARRAGRSASKSATGLFEDPQGREITFRMTPSEFQESLEQFYSGGRELLRGFLADHGRSGLPYAVVFAGGGSRIAGVRDQVVAEVLREIAPEEADAVLDRITMNEKAIDRAIAMGAALVANGIVRVQERLLCDIGIVSDVDGKLARHLGLGEADAKIILAPVLSRGSVLPATFRVSDHEGLPFLYAPAGEDLPVEVVVFDDPDDPWVQSWEIPHPADGQNVLLELQMDADTDGALEVTFRPVGRREVTLTGRLSRERTGHAKLLWRVEGTENGHSRWRRVSLEQLEAALKKARGGGGSQQ